jgi:hypothetical protein
MTFPRSASLGPAARMSAPQLLQSIDPWHQPANMHTLIPSRRWRKYSEVGDKVGSVDNAER